MNEAVDESSGIESVLRRLDQARASLIEMLESCPPEDFSKETRQGQSVRRMSEETADDINFRFGRLVSRSLSRPQQACLPKADFGTLREAIISLQVAHRRYTNMLHDLTPADLDRSAVDEEHGTHKLGSVIEQTSAYYSTQAQRISDILIELAAAPG